MVIRAVVIRDKKVLGVIHCHRGVLLATKHEILTEAV
jgi:hypothetical protein